MDVIVNIHLAGRGAVFKQYILAETTIGEDLLDGLLEFGCVESAPDLAFDRHPDALLENLIRQRCVGVDALVDGHLHVRPHPLFA